jgi:hypothetical protein
MKRVALSALIALVTTSSIAQTTTDQDKYYVVHNPDSNECTIEEQEPTDKTTLSTSSTRGPMPRRPLSYWKSASRTWMTIDPVVLRERRTTWLTKSMSRNSNKGLLRGLCGVPKTIGSL